MLLSEAKLCIRFFGRGGMETILDQYYDEGVLLAAMECEVAEVPEVYEGEYDSDEEFVQELLEDTTPGLDELPGYIHIDWESTARDIMMDYCESGGYYFRMQ